MRPTKYFRNVQEYLKEILPPNSCVSKLYQSVIFYYAIFVFYYHFLNNFLLNLIRVLFKSIKIAVVAELLLLFIHQ